MFETVVTAQQIVSTKILSQKGEVMLPSDFKQMDINTIILKYPNEGGRPNEVYTNTNSSVNIAFTHSIKKATASDIKKHADELIKILKQRGLTIISQSQEKIKGKDFLMVEFNSKALNGTLYNKMFFTTLEGRLLIGSFNCTSAMEGQWKKKGYEIIQSIKLL
ncbi:MAG: hypothetical protein ABIP80_01800 [Ferruginibacter sp.]